MVFCYTYIRGPLNYIFLTLSVLYLCIHILILVFWFIELHSACGNLCLMNQRKKLSRVWPSQKSFRGRWLRVWRHWSQTKRKFSRRYEWKCGYFFINWRSSESVLLMYHNGSVLTAYYCWLLTAYYCIISGKCFKCTPDKDQLEAVQTNSINTKVTTVKENNGENNHRQASHFYLNFHFQKASMVLICKNITLRWRV